MNNRTNSLRAELAHQREQRSRAWSSYYAARRDGRRSLEEMNTIVDVIAKAHAEVKRLSVELEKQARHDREVSEDIARLQNEALTNSVTGGEATNFQGRN